MKTVTFLLVNGTSACMSLAYIYLGACRKMFISGGAQLSRPSLVIVVYLHQRDFNRNSIPPFLDKPQEGHLLVFCHHGYTTLRPIGRIFGRGVTSMCDVYAAMHI